MNRLQRTGSGWWRALVIYAAGVWGALTVWAALAQFVLPGRGHALGKLGAFYWVLPINTLPALLCALGFAMGSTSLRDLAPSSFPRLRVALVLGLLFPVSLRLLRPLFGLADAGMLPALAWCVLGSAGAGAWLVRWERGNNQR